MFYWIGAILVLVAAFLVFRGPVRFDYLNKGSLSVTSTILETLIFALHANLPYLYLAVPWPQLPALPENLWLRYLGLSIILVGTILTLAIMAYLGFSTSLGSGTSTLRETGPYRWSRNPQLLTYGLVILGFIILYPFPRIRNLALALLPNRTPYGDHRRRVSQNCFWD